ncbi:exodeoxyribonuclease III [Sphingomicrobium astaxanthinifaciens]|uniref:exodeoxyribonuclease III n=1 Tax=Sphingomicrobium astaxanthinifaciens TaxID=1227949 RepID=UPI001FCB1E04|nr:exodeoxyribonuclease III [Sphingomicrobium astaxanthinifaciens]MCJ7421190.1 exodeoxyribonuclease III [Sphingomicrobium astaxanthinifaciens]
MTRLKIASWNINSVRARPDLVSRFLDHADPDILCLQETKADNSAFPRGFFEERGYRHIALNGQRMHHGVATIARVPLEEDLRHDWQDNGEARHVGVRVAGQFRLENVYVPAGGDVPDRAENPKFGQKLDFIDRMTAWAQKLAEPTLLVGDFNVAPLECDVWSHKALLKVVSHTPIEIAALERLQAAHDWVDLGRRFIPAPQRCYTWWSYRSKDHTKNDRGRRLDHMWASPVLAGKVVHHEVHEPVRSWEKPSDHVPLVCEIAL